MMLKDRIGLLELISSKWDQEIHAEFLAAFFVLCEDLLS